MHEHRLPTQISRKIVAWFFHLAFVAQEDPVSLEDRFHLGIENIRVEIDITVDPEDALLQPVVNHIRYPHRAYHSIHYFASYSAAVGTAYPNAEEISRDASRTYSMQLSRRPSDKRTSGPKIHTLPFTEPSRLKTGAAIAPRPL